MVIVYQTMHYVVVERRLEVDVEDGMVVFRLKEIGEVVHRDGLDKIVVLISDDIVKFVAILGDFDV